MQDNNDPILVGPGPKKKADLSQFKPSTQKADLSMFRGEEPAPQGYNKGSGYKVAAGFLWNTVVGTLSKGVGGIASLFEDVAKGVYNLEGKMFGGFHPSLVGPPGIVNPLTAYAAEAEKQGKGSHWQSMAGDFFKKIEDQLSTAPMSTPQGYENMKFWDRIQQPSFWYNEFGEGLEFGAGFLIPGAVAGKIGAGTKLVTTIGKAERLSEMSKAAQIAGKSLDLLTGSAIMSAMEGSEEARNLYETLRPQLAKYYMDRGMSPMDAFKQADINATKAARESFTGNMGYLMLTNSFELGTILRPLKRAGAMYKAAKVGEYLTTGASEGTEEVLQSGIERYEKAKWLDGDYGDDNHFNFIHSTGEAVQGLLHDTDTQISGFLGALTGGVMMGGRSVATYPARVKIKNMYKRAMGTDLAGVTGVFQAENGKVTVNPDKVTQVMKTVNQYKMINDIFREGEEKGSPELLDFGHHLLAANMAFNELESKKDPNKIKAAYEKVLDSNKVEGDLVDLYDNPISFEEYKNLKGQYLDNALAAYKAVYPQIQKLDPKQRKEAYQAFANAAFFQEKNPAIAAKYNELFKQLLTPKVQQKGDQSEEVKETSKAKRQQAKQDMFDRSEPPPATPPPTSEPKIVNMGDAMRGGPVEGKRRSDYEKTSNLGNDKKTPETVEASEKNGKITFVTNTTNKNGEPRQQNYKKYYDIDEFLKEIPITDDFLEDSGGTLKERIQNSLNASSFRTMAVTEIRLNKNGIPAAATIVIGGQRYEVTLNLPSSGPKIVDMGSALRGETPKEEGPKVVDMGSVLRQQMGMEPNKKSEYDKSVEVDENTLGKIADKIQKGEKLTPEEHAMFESKTSRINEILKARKDVEDLAERQKKMFDQIMGNVSEDPVDPIEPIKSVEERNIDPEQYTEDTDDSIEQELLERPDQTKKENAYNTLAYSSRKHINKNNIDNVLNEGMLSKEILDPEVVKPGTRLTLELADDPDIITYHNNQEVKWGDIRPDEKSGAYRDKVPIVVKMDGKPIAYLHNVDWVTENNIYGDIKLNIDNLRRVREHLVSKKTAETIVTKRSNGALFFDVNMELKPLTESMPTLPIAVAWRNDLVGARLPVGAKIKEGRVYAVADNEVIPVKQNRLTPIQVSSIVSAVKNFITQHLDTHGKWVLKNMRLDLTKAEGLSNYIRHFTHLYNVPDAAKDFDRGKYRSPLGAIAAFKNDGFRAITVQGNSVDFAIGGGIADYSLSSHTPEENRGMFLKFLGNALSQMHFHVAKENLGKDINLVTWDGTQVQSQPMKYDEYARQNLSSSVIPQNIGTETQPKWIYRINPVITFDTGFLAEPAKTEEKEDKGSLSDVVLDIDLLPAGETNLAEGKIDIDYLLQRGIIDQVNENRKPCK